MKTKRICKSTVSMILALIMLVSMCTVAFVNVSAAEADVATTGAGTTVYFQNNWKWTDVRIHVWDSNQTALAGNWPGATMTKVGTNGDYDYYKYTLPTNAAGFIFNGLKNDNSGTRDQSPDMTTIPTNDHFYYMTWSDGNQCVQAEESITVKFPSEGGGSTDPDVPVDPADKVTISFLLNTDTKWVSSDDAKMFINDGAEVIQMDETVDTKSGHVMWTADVAANSSYTFYRTSYFFDEDNASTGAWNSWTASSRGTNTVYKATGSGSGSWAAASTVNAADPEDITNFWDDLWIDTRGEGNVEHAVKVYYNGTTFDLFVPSYVDLSNVTVYSDHEKVVIGGTEYASGSKANLTTGTKTFAFKDGSTTTNKGSLNIYQTQSTAAMLMTTKEELYTGTTAGLQNSNAWPSGSGITATNYNAVYKDAIETKGSIYVYDEEGAQVNSDTVLKKIKGRGNSSFEASMKIYGKYAYNFNLDKKVALIDGAEKSKKWCLLANNVDHSMLRNTFAYQIADDLGLSYGPETRLVDVYDNGKYLGAYVITEKVEYGGSTLMDDMNNLDDGNVLANSVFVEGTDPEDEEFLYEFDTDDLDDGIETSMTVGGKTYKYKYYATYDRPEVTDEETGDVLVEAASNLKFESPENYNTEYNYLLEHELTSRFTAEASWFVTPKGQPVVVKYPEFATQEEMKWIITEYATMEQAVYNNDYATYSQLIDVESFAKMYLIQELSINLDSCATSYYIHNEFRNGKSVLVAGPVWDFDWAFGAYAKDLKYIYNGSSVTSSKNMSDPQQMFVKNKAIQTDASSSNGVTWEANYNLQAKLANNSSFWTECQRIWTNQMADLLYNYIKDDANDQGIIIDTWMPAFTSSVDMNNKRWGVYNRNNIADQGGDDWGTKVTSDYTPYSYNFKVGDTSSSGSSSKCYANTVYYLNDWLKTRRDYMSSESGGNLYNATLLDPIELKSVTMDATQSGNTVTVNVTIDATNNGVQIADANKFYELFVNGESKGEYPVTEAATVTLEENVETNIYVVGYLTDDDSKSMESASQKFTYTVTGPEYKVENVKFEAVQSADEATVTVTPAAVVTVDGVEVKADQINYTVYLNGSAYGTYTFETASVDVNLTEGIVNEIYIKVSPVGSSVSGTSVTEKFSYNVQAEKVEVTFNFKSSNSYRYIPKVTVGENAAVTMTKTGNAIGKNASQTQSYYWYTATVELPADTATRVTFSNDYSMNAVVTLTLSESATYYYGVDNLNDGITAVDLTDADEYVRNFIKSATHMVTNDPEEAGVATTSIDGTIYKMGDADEDNTVSVLDATTIQLALVGKTELSDTASDLSDYDLDATTSIMDATNVQVYLASGN